MHWLPRSPAAASAGPKSRVSRVEFAIKEAAEGDFGLSAAEIRKLAEKLPPDHSMIIGLFENLWERKFKEVAGKYAGAVTDQRLISPEALARAASTLVGERAARV